MFIRHKTLTTVVFLQLVGLKVVIIDYVNLAYYNILRVFKSMLSFAQID
jgi:hypothetical protein